jgi:hypothetical protein
MIRRGFWLTAGAVAGIYGYRRASALGRRAREVWGGRGGLGGKVSLQEQGGSGGDRPPRGYIALAAETIRFTRDVREGMELYTARHSAPEGSTLGARGLEPGLGARGLEPGLGARGLEPGRMTDQDPQPKDGR